jgi:argininosuccinate lyase
MQIRPERMEAALDDGMLATELADYLVTKGVPFRESHHLVGEVVRLTEERGCTLRALELEAYQAIDPRFDKDLYEALDYRQAVRRRVVPCGTSPSAVKAQIERASVLLQDESPSS